MPPRSTDDVFDSHLALRKAGELERDIAQNYAPDVVLLTCTGTFTGHQGVRDCAAELQRYFPHGTYDYVLRQVHGEVAFLVWNGQSSRGDVRGGADTFLIRDGRIAVQTIHYTVDAHGGAS